MPYLSLAENIFLGNEHATRGFIDWNETLRHATEVLRRVGLDDHPETRVADIGVGKQQLVEIAKALSKKVKLLILDEPTAALNDEDSGKLLDLILELKKQGITSIIISHKLNEIRRVADSVTILRDGRTIETLDVKAPETTEDRIIASAWSAGTWRTASRNAPRTSRRRARRPPWRSATGPCTTRSTSTARWSTTCRCTCGAGRSSASPG